MDYLKNIKKDYKDINDLIINEFNNITFIYLQTLCDQDKIDNYILKYIKLNKKYLISPNTKEIKNYLELKKYLENGFLIIINNKEIYAIEVKTVLTRNISTPSTEPSRYGPKDSLVENIEDNLGLIRRRIKTEHLKSINIEIGKVTKTSTNIIYIDNIADINLVKTIKDKLNNINIDGLLDISILKKYFSNNNIFPTVRMTERPDLISTSLLQGKVVILLDTSPYALILPSFFSDFINPISNNYTKKISANFLKILRIISFLLSIIIPGFYVAITTYNQETIPTTLLINFQNQRIGVPIPAFLECLLTIITCEILKESDIRFPSAYGSSISILGALVLGEAAVSAGIVSPIMIIVVSISYISSLLFTDLEISNAIRYWRFIFLLCGSSFGLYGIGLCLLFFLINLSSIETFNISYLYPLIPYDLPYLKETLISGDNNKRSKILSKNRIKGAK